MAQLAENYRSPVFLSLLGLPTIHALGIVERVTQDFHYHQDQHSAACITIQWQVDGWKQV